METLYDVQQLFKQFGMYIYVGARIYDIELMMIELKKLYEGQLVDRDTIFLIQSSLTQYHKSVHRHKYTSQTV